MKYPIPEKALQQNIIVLGKTGAGKSSSGRTIVECMLDDHLPICIIDPKGDWWGIKLSADGKRPGYPLVIFGGKHADVPITDRAGAQVAELFATGNRPCLIDLRGWMPGERARFFVDFAAALYKHNVGRKWVLLDECHNFAPKGKVLDVEAGKCLHWANKLASEGRGLGVNLIGLSQRPQKVHNDFLTSCETLIALRVLHASDREAYRDWIDGCGDPAKGKQMLATIANLKRGTGYVWSPEIEFGPELVSFPMFRTYDSFKPQEASDAARLTGWAEVDLDEVKQRLQVVVAEHAANDPAELRKRIRELEKQLANGAGKTDADIGEARQTGEKDGYNRGFNDGANHAYQCGWDAHVDAVSNAIAGLPKNPPVIGDTIDARPENPVRIETRQLGGGKQQSRAVVQLDKPSGWPVPTPPRAQQIDGARVAGGEKLSKAERKILIALAQYPEGRSKTQVAVLAAYAVTGGGFNNAIGSLRSKGYIEGTGDRLQNTDAGLAALGSYEPLPTGAALLEHWLPQLGKAERAALETLATVYPRALTKDDLAKRSGYEASGGGFNNALGRLRTLELITRGADIRASDHLF